MQKAAAGCEYRILSSKLPIKLILNMFLKPFRISLLAVTLLTIAHGALAQTAVKESSKGWHMMDPQKDGVYGIGVEKLYETILKDKKPKQMVVVAVIDSGIDTTHEDLKPVLWKNPGELPGNGMDDDKNGYVDDVYGWNFLGNKDGRNVTKDSYEAARVYYKFKPKYGKDGLDENALSTDEKEELRLFLKAKGQIESQAKEAGMYVIFLKNIVEKLPSADSILKSALGRETYTGDELLAFKAQNPDQTKAKSTLMGLFQQTQQMENSNKVLIEGITEFYNGEKSKIEAAEKEPFNYRGSVVGDKYDDPTDRFYGNSDVMATTSMHGTHVAGIIAASRTNDKGIKGVANSVRIMMLRAVPDGDEHDKDIANAIRYAVDNGALVINMSFGKSFSPEKKWVDEAVRYAESKGVLLVHAAGNDGKNIDENDNFPNARYDNNAATKASNWITVGASGPTTKDLVASFSNYGKDVDVFSPGVEIYSTLPGGNEYGNQQGTSMASPVTAGIAALILSYYPELSARQVKYVIEKSTTPVPSIMVTKPGTEEEVKLEEISKTGGIVNAYEAVKLAGTLKGERVQPKPLPKSTLKKSGKG
jgi:subtilisin family serine protease